VTVLSGELDAAQALIDAATPAPWRLGGPPMTSEIWSGYEADWDAFMVAECTTRLNPDASPQSDADAAFIAASRSLVPALVSEVRQLQDQLAGVRGLIWNALQVHLTRDGQDFLVPLVSTDDLVAALDVVVGLSIKGETA
jgi:hypothetical protein